MRRHVLQERLRAIDPVLRTGRVVGLQANWLEANGPNVPLGTLCHVDAKGSREGAHLMAEVVRVSQDRVTLSILDGEGQAFAGARVTASATGSQVAVGRACLGRALDALGNPLDGDPPVVADTFVPLIGKATPPLARSVRAQILTTGVRAIDALLTLSQGQRVGVFAASGGGKTSLMQQVAGTASADVVIYCLIGERGREVEAVWRAGIGEQARSRTTLVAATSDQSASMRVRAAYYALALADYWRAQGCHVLLLMDSVTRLAMAMREIGLAAGEPPTVRAYTPGVFAAVPWLVERCGALAGGGAISAIMTVLCESDEVDDPISEMMKSLLDGHIILSRELGAKGHFPAIDIPRSMSRLADSLVDIGKRGQARRVRGWIKSYDEARTLIDAGLYVSGGNPALDRAIERQSEIARFLVQDRDQSVDLATTWRELAALAGAEHADAA
jgi:flagellum-specific ATP synthase